MGISAMVEAVPDGAPVPTSKRQHRHTESKRKIVEETLPPGVSVARVARAHGVNANQVFQWRRLCRAGKLGAPVARLANASRLLPVSVSESATIDAVETSSTPPGTVHLELRKVGCGSKATLIRRCCAWY